MCQQTNFLSSTAKSAEEAKSKRDFDLLIWCCTKPSVLAPHWKITHSAKMLRLTTRSNFRVRFISAYRNNPTNWLDWRPEGSSIFNQYTGISLTLNRKDPNYLSTNCEHSTFQVYYPIEKATRDKTRQEGLGRYRITRIQLHNYGVFNLKNQQRLIKKNWVEILYKVKKVMLYVWRSWAWESLMGNNYWSFYGTISDHCTQGLGLAATMLVSLFIC